MASSNMVDRSCSVDGCARSATTREWCGRHYKAWLAQGNRVFPSNGGRCSIDGCTNQPPSRAAPYCNAHRIRLRRHGSPDLPVRISNGTKACSIEGCSERRYKRDWCSRHYRAWWTHGDPHFVARPPNGGRCSVLGCERTPRSSTSPHCEVHYGRLRRSGTLDTTLTANRLETANGYVLIPVRGHPMNTPGSPSHAFEHRVVFYDAHGPGPHACHVCGKEAMLADQHVDHLNEVTNDNRLENLKPACPLCNQWRDKDRVTVARTQARVRWLELNGERLPLSAWARRIGISPSALDFRLQSGWGIERALTKPRGVTGPRPTAHGAMQR